MDKYRQFWKKLAQFSREELLGLIEEQDPELIKEVRRIEWVFEHKLTHLTWSDGTPIKGRLVTNEELALLVDPPFEVDRDLTKIGLSPDQQRQVWLASDSCLWARHFLNLRPRAYQILMLRHPQSRKVLRAGRRLGKSYTMALFMLHYAYTHNYGRILVLTPMKTHAEILFKELEKMIAASPTIKESVKRAITSPHPIIELANGSTIRFFSTGMSSGGKANVARGQEADVIVLDELDYMGPDDLDAILAMLQKTSDTTEEKILIGASTPTGKREKFWDWCTRGTRPDPETGAPARFREFWYPSYCNPYFDKEREQEFREEYTENVYRHEIEAEWGEDSDGVFLRRYLDVAFSQADWQYKTEVPANNSFFIMGVDWDKYGAGTNILVLEVCNEYYQDEVFARRIRPVFREETKRDEFTYTKAVKRIIDLNAIFQPEHIYVDRGSGEMQVEELKRHGMDHPETMLAKRVRGISFSENVIAYDPVNKQEVKKKMKPFMVDNLQRILEREHIVLPTSDEHLYRQMLGYTIVRTTQFGDPVFQEGEAGDHALDALMLACLALTQNYGDMLRVNLARRSVSVSGHAFMPLIGLSDVDEVRSNQEEILVETYGSTTAAPVLRKRAMAKLAKTERTITRPMF